MPIQLDTPPKQSLRVVAEAVQKLPVVAPSAAFGPIHAARGPVAAAAAHRVYQIGLEDVAQKRGLAKKRFVGWRYLVFDAGDSAVAAYIPSSHPTRIGTSASANAGPFVDGTKRAIAYAERLKVVKAGKFNLSVLHVPGLYVMALWLRRAGDPTRDLVIPIEPKPAFLKKKNYSVPGFLDEVAAAAAKVLSYKTR